MTESNPAETANERVDRSERAGVGCRRWFEGIEDVEDGCGCVEIWERLSEERAER